MPDRKQNRSIAKGVAEDGDGRGQPVSAFDTWLDRGLKTLFADVVEEPIPPELLKIIEQGGQK